MAKRTDKAEATSDRGGRQGHTGKARQRETTGTAVLTRVPPIWNCQCCMHQPISMVWGCGRPSTVRTTGAQAVATVATPSLLHR